MVGLALVDSVVGILEIVLEIHQMDLVQLPVDSVEEAAVLVDRASLPAAILTRDKTPLGADPMAVVMRERTLPPLQSAETLARWIDLRRLHAEGTGTDWLENLLRAHTLDHWLATFTV